jgi:hypothetical protein
VANHIHGKEEGNRMSSQPIGMINRNFANYKTKWSTPGSHNFSEKVSTGQASLSIHTRVNVSHCHNCLNHLEKSAVVAAHCILLDNASILAKKY